MHRSPHDILSEQVSLGLEPLLEQREKDPESVMISQSVVYESDYVITVDEQDYYACEFQEEDSEDEGSSKDNLLLFSGDQIEQAKANAKELQELMPKTTAFVSMRLNVDLDSIRDEGEVAKECNYVESVMLEMFGPWDFFRMFLLSFFK